MIHGVGYSGPNGAKNAAIDAGVSCIIGHLHSFAAVNFIKTGNKTIWGCNAGCLIDNNSYAFQYNRNDRNKPIISAAVIMDDGRFPIIIPMKE